MELISLKSQDSSLSFSDIFSISAPIRSVICITAYADIDSIRYLIKYLSKEKDGRGKASLAIYIDKASSRFFSDSQSRRCLLAEQKKIQKRFSDNSGIFLVQFGKLFHSKAYVVEGNSCGKIILGSMNFTQKGMFDNEEILLRGTYKVSGNTVTNRLAKWVREYSDKLKERSIQVNDGADGKYPSCMRQLLLNGSIFYELKEQSPFRFKLNLPSSVLRQEGNIDSLLESNGTDGISIETLISAGRPSGLGVVLPRDKDKNKASWKKYCVETCYGFWSPCVLKDDLEETLDARKQKRAPYYNEIFKILKDKKKRGDIDEKFVLLCKRIQEYLEKRKIYNWKYAKSEVALAAWNKWYSALLLKIENDGFCDRLISGVGSVPAPDVWSDPMSSAEFEDSFLDSVIYVWSKEYSKETSNVVAQAISYNLGMEDGKANVSSPELRDSINRWLLDDNETSIFKISDEWL